MHQPWRTFTTVINRCISGKSTGLDKLRPSRAQILWGIKYDACMLLDNCESDMAIGPYGELDGVVSPSDELDTPKLVKLVKMGPSGELDGTPTLPDGRDTTKTVETNLVILRRLWFYAILNLTSVLTTLLLLVAPQVVFRCVVIEEGVTEWYQSTGYIELGQQVVGVISNDFWLEVCDFSTFLGRSTYKVYVVLWMEPNMNPIAAQQVALDNALVVLEKRLKICPRLLNQDFVEPPTDEEMVPFIKDRGCISGKSTSLDRLRPSRAQMLWGMFYKKNVDFLALLWEDFLFQADNRDISLACKENMPYPRFTKVIINHFISKEKTISMRNMINLNRIRDDSLLAIKDSKEFKIYLSFATGEATPKKAKKFKKIASPSKKQTLVLEEEPAKKPKQAKHPEPAKKSAPAKKDVSSKKPSRKQSTGVQIRDTLGVSVSKKKAPATTKRSKGIDLLSGAAFLEDAQMKKVLKQSKNETHSHQVSGSGYGVGVPNVPKDQSESENESWGESGEDDDGNDDDNNDDVGDNDSDNERTESDEDENLNLNQNNDDIEEEYKDEYVRTPSSYESTDDENEHVDEEEYDHIDEELYKDVNIKLKDVKHREEGKRDAEMTDVGLDDVTQETTYDQVEDDAHVILTISHVSQKTKVPL
ncbi:hypothetical protein Tco_0099928 [Tanacetum coccineum]